MSTVENTQQLILFTFDLITVGAFHKTIGEAFRLYIAIQISNTRHVFYNLHVE